jgi:hypothetical protein
MGYCWTHCFTWNAEHMTANYKKKAEGHQDDATLASMKGENAKITRKHCDKPSSAFKNQQTAKMDFSQGRNY